MQRRPEIFGLKVSRKISLADYQPHDLEPVILASEEAVGRAMLAELEKTARNKKGFINSPTQAK